MDKVKTTSTESIVETKHPDLVYHYNGQAYPLYYKDGSSSDLVEDENTTALSELAENSGGFVTFTFPGKEKKHFYWFDSEFDGYDYMEKTDKNPIIGRRFKVSLRTNELRENLMAKYGGEVDYNNPVVYAEAKLGVEAIYIELKIQEICLEIWKLLLGKKVKNKLVNDLLTR
jgi:hypothetical protein